MKIHIYAMYLNYLDNTLFKTIKQNEKQITNSIWFDGTFVHVFNFILSRDKTVQRKSAFVKSKMQNDKNINYHIQRKNEANT